MHRLFATAAGGALLAAAVGAAFAVVAALAVRGVAGLAALALALAVCWAVAARAAIALATFARHVYFRLCLREYTLARLQQSEQVEYQLDGSTEA